ncbi:5,6-dimethylbenzimidazole synthase, partial [Streptomyces werraensis]
MTDTGQVPGEGLPENAGRVEQPGVAAPDAYTYLSDSPAEDEDLLLPGAQGAWGNEIAPPAPEPVVETVHQPGPHETDGRDSGSVDLGGVRPPEPRQQAPAPAPSPAPAAPRRPLHLGPPLPDLSASPVRSLADRGPADLPARQPGPPTLGPEYLDVPRAREAAAPQGAPWVAQGAAAPAGQTVDAAQAAVARVATQAVAAEGGQTPEAAYGAQATPVVPGPGAPGDAVAGDDGNAPTAGDAAPGEVTEAAQQAGVAVAQEAAADGTVTPEAGQTPVTAVTGPG